MKIFSPNFVGSFLLVVLSALAFLANSKMQPEIIPIGQVQGRAFTSPLEGEKVRLRGVVTGKLEDTNQAGIRYHTFFIQNTTESSDGDPLSSDGIAVFSGRNRANVEIGDLVRIDGFITEYYGLTEIDDKELQLQIEKRNQPLPEPIFIDPPNDNLRSVEYLEKYEGMRVALGQSVVVGPTHVGCGFAVTTGSERVKRVVKRSQEDPAGQIINVLNTSDTYCDHFPAVNTGDEVDGLLGPLVYHFDQFKIVNQNPTTLNIQTHRTNVEKIPLFNDGPIITVVTYNLYDYFDSFSSEGAAFEPIVTPPEMVTKEVKASHTIADYLKCPTLIGLQEVENKGLLDSLSTSLSELCKIVYTVSHLESPDARGSDVALLSDPSRVSIDEFRLRQTCSDLMTGIQDETIECPQGESPLFSRPPLEVKMTIDMTPVTVIVNHFKSKRGGESETARWRQLQASALAKIVRESQQTTASSATIVLGDFNDYQASPVMTTLSREGHLVDVFANMPILEAYSYNFGGVSQLVDWMLVSPSLAERVVATEIIHLNADYANALGSDLRQEWLAYRSSDHDIPWMAISMGKTVESQGPTTGDQSIREEGGATNSWTQNRWLYIGSLVVIGLLLPISILIFGRLRRSKAIRESPPD